jgi:hypothetical protein
MARLQINMDKSRKAVGSGLGGHQRVTISVEEDWFDPECTQWSAERFSHAPSLEGGVGLERRYEALWQTS